MVQVAHCGQNAFAFAKTGGSTSSHPSPLLCLSCRCDRRAMASSSRLALPTALCARLPPYGCSKGLQPCSAKTVPEECPAPGHVGYTTSPHRKTLPRSGHEAARCRTNNETVRAGCKVGSTLSSACVANWRSKRQYTRMLARWKISKYIPSRAKRHASRRLYRNSRLTEPTYRHSGAFVSFRKPIDVVRFERDDPSFDPSTSPTCSTWRQSSVYAELSWCSYAFGNGMANAQTLRRRLFAKLCGRAIICHP